MTTIFILLGMVVSGVWIWKRLSPDAQDLILDQAPAAGGRDDDCVSSFGCWSASFAGGVSETRRTRLITLFEKQTVAEKRLRWRSPLIEVNEYRREGLEEIAPQLQEVFLTTLTRARAISSITCVAWRPVTWA